MKVHLTPSIYNKYSDVHVELIDLEFPDLNLVLKQGGDVVACTPYPNKRINVVRRKKGRKAINGFFVDIPEDMKTFILKTRWSDFKDGRLYYRMGKNQKLVSLKIPDKAQKILDHYKTKKSKKNDPSRKEIMAVLS